MTAVDGREVQSYAQAMTRVDQIFNEVAQLSSEERSELMQRMQALPPANDDAEQDELDDAERAELHASLERAAADSEAGRGMDAMEFLRRRRESLHTG